MKLKLGKQKISQNKTGQEEEATWLDTFSLVRVTSVCVWMNKCFESRKFPAGRCRPPNEAAINSGNYMYQATNKNKFILK